MRVVHAAPPEGSGLTPCCSRPPFELHRDDRLTHLADRVTCKPAPTVPQLLDLEQQWGYAHTGRKDEAIRDQLSITPARFYVLLNRAIDSPEGNAHAPALCRQLRNLRAEHDTHRTTRQP